MPSGHDGCLLFFKTGVCLRHNFFMTGISSNSTSLSFSTLASFLTEIKISVDSGKIFLLSLKNSLKSLFILLRLTELPTRVLAAIPSLLKPRSLRYAKIIKLPVRSLIPFFLIFKKSFLRRSLSSRLKEFSCHLCRSRRVTTTFTYCFLSSRTNVSCPLPFFC